MELGKAPTARAGREIPAPRVSSGNDFHLFNHNEGTKNHLPEGFYEATTLQLSSPLQEEQIPPAPSQIHPSERKKRSGTTHGDEEFLDLLHGVGHEGVGLAGGPENLDEDVQIHVEMGVFGISPLAELLLLERSTAQGPKIY